MNRITICCLLVIFGINAINTLGAKIQKKSTSFESEATKASRCSSNGESYSSCRCKTGYSGDGYTCVENGFALTEFGFVNKKTPWDSSPVVLGKPYTERINFANCFPSPPQVFMTIQALDSDHTKSSYRVNVYAKDITAQGFTAVFETWADTVMYLVNANWVAYYPKADYSNNDFDGALVKKTTPWDSSPIKDGAPFSTSVKFGESFSAPPQVYLSSSFYDIDHTRNMRFNLVSEKVSQTSFDAKYTTWADTIAYTIHANYHAVSRCNGNGCGRTQFRAGKVEKTTPWDSSPLKLNAPFTTKVNFGFRFASVPTVLIAPYFLDVANNANFRLNVEAKDVSVDGFTACFSTWADSTIYTTHATWLAFAPGAVN